MEGSESRRLRPLVVESPLQEVKLQRTGVETKAIPPRRQRAEQPPPHWREPQVGDGRIVGVENALEIPDAPANIAFQPWCARISAQRKRLPPLAGPFVES